MSSMEYAGNIVVLPLAHTKKRTVGFGAHASEIAEILIKFQHFSQVLARKMAA